MIVGNNGRCIKGVVFIHSVIDISAQRSQRLIRIVITSRNYTVLLRKAKNITLNDIAKYTNFSKTTVSRYFNVPDSLTLEKLDYKEIFRDFWISAGKDSWNSVTMTERKASSSLKIPMQKKENRYH